MKVVVLATKKPEPYSNIKTKFYFKDHQDAKVFLDVFKDHWCHVDFDETEEDIDDNDKRLDYINDDPKKRAESNLSWGFAFEKMYGDDKLTKYEESWIENFMKEVRKRSNR